ncbi:hypothetical protein [Streptomyces sp. NPDC090026]|uniref:hypothetical protein n=1 Tax=Streptomyces sp. NPDC090026 TaxID=3365923 RepID=UPI00380E82EC
MNASDASGHAFEAAAQQLPDLSIDQLADDLRGLARSYATTPVSESWRGASRALKSAQAMLDRTQRTRQRTDLYFHAATASALMSSAAFDLGSLPTATQLARTCALYGQIIDHHPSQAYAAGQLAVLAYWDGRPAQAVQHAMAATAYSDVGDSARLRLAVIAARAHAHLRDATRVAAHLVTGSLDDPPARAATDDLHDDVGGEFDMPTMRAVMSNATTYLLLQDAGRASEAATRALESGTLSPVQFANAATDLARAQLMRGDVDAAAEPAAKALSLEPSLCTAAVTDRLSALRHDLAQPRIRNTSQARDLGERIEYFTATAAPAALLGTPPALETPES